MLGLGPNLFYNSPMEACVVTCRTRKPPKRKGMVLFIDAVNEVARERAMSFLKPEHQARIEGAYAAFMDEEGFARVASIAEMGAQGWSLSIPLYIKRTVATAGEGTARTLREAWADWESSGRVFWTEMDAVVERLDGLTEEDVAEVISG